MRPILTMFLGAMLGLAASGADAPVSAGTIAPMAATASGTQASNPAMAIDGSGLQEDPAHPGVFTHLAKRWSESGCMWCSGGEPIGAGGTCWLRVDLGRAANVTGLHIWNYNEGGGWEKRSLKTVDLLASVDDQTWTPAGSYTLRCASGTDSEPGEAVTLAKPVTARYFKLVATATYGRDNLGGIAELRVRVADPKPGDRVLSARPPFKSRYARTTYPARALGRPWPGGEDVVWPADAGVVDVTKPPYGAKGDGVADDTAAIQRAFDDHVADCSIIYLPNGIFLISDTIRWGSRKGPDGKPKPGDAEKYTSLMGQSEHGTVLKLRDGTPRFSDARKPQPLIWTGGDPAQRFGNEIAHLTVDTGAGNPGCAGVAFVANNQGAIHHVTIVSGDGQGTAGLNFATAGENGPLLARAVTVIGFDVGVAAAAPINGVTIEGLTLRDQNLVGVQNFGQHLSLRQVISSNEVPVLTHKGAVTVLLDSTLTGTGVAKGLSAIRGSGALLVRNTTGSGYAALIEGRAGLAVVEHASSPTVTLAPTAAQGLHLPIKELPATRWDPPAKWASPLAFGGKPDDNQDDSAAIQQAIDSGATTVYLPRGLWRVGAPIIVRGAVQRLVGCRAVFDTVDGKRRAEPLIRIADGAGSVDLERLNGPWHGTKVVVSQTARTVILRHCGNVSADFAGGGEVFLDDDVNNPGANFTFTGVTVWARQFNAEAQGVHTLNDNSRLWILGMKTESSGVLIETRNGGVTEVLGGLSYTSGGSGNVPMFTVTDGKLSLSFGEVCWDDRFYRVIVRETRNGQTRELRADDPRWGRSMALFSSE